MLARLCLKSLKLGFNSTWTENFQEYKPDLEKAEETEIKLPAFGGSLKKAREIQKKKKKSTSAPLTTLKALTV